MRIRRPTGSILLSLSSLGSLPTVNPVVPHVLANPATGQLEVLALVAFARIPEVLACAGVPETLTQSPLQHDLYDIF